MRANSSTPGGTDGTAGRSVPAALLLTLALLASLSPLATDLYLPAFPRMTRDLATAGSGVQLTLTSFLVGLAAGQLVFGPLSDRLGRRGPLLVSTVICVLASLSAAFAPNLGLLLAARFVQGLTGAGGVVIGRAVISDLLTGAAAANAFTLMMTVGGVAPVVAPFIGSLLAGPVGWRGILYLITAVCVVMVVCVACFVPETRLPDARRRQTTRAGSFRELLHSRSYRSYTLVFMFAFGLLMSYISASPFIYQDVLGWSATVYGLTFGINATAMVATGWLVTRLMRRVTPERIILTCLAAQFIACAVLLLLVVTGAPSWTYAIAIFCAVLTLGGVMGPSAGLAMSSVRHIGGSASAVMGTGQYVLGAGLSPLVGLGGTDSALAPAVVMLCCVVVANIGARAVAGASG